MEQLKVGLYSDWDPDMRHNTTQVHPNTHHSRSILDQRSTLLIHMSRIILDLFPLILLSLYQIVQTLIRRTPDTMRLQFTKPEFIS